MWRYEKEYLKDTIKPFIKISIAINVWISSEKNLTILSLYVANEIYGSKNFSRVITDKTRILTFYHFNKFRKSKFDSVNGRVK